MVGTITSSAETSPKWHRTLARPRRRTLNPTEVWLVSRVQVPGASGGAEERAMVVMPVTVRPERRLWETGPSLALRGSRQRGRQWAHCGGDRRGAGIVSAQQARGPDPADVGLPEGPRRRTPGLRRAELATLAGVSVDYLIRLEQGRDTHPSVQV